MIKKFRNGLIWIWILALLVITSACQGQAALPAAPDLKATAYAEATQISLENEATAIVQAAHATAAARLAQIAGATPTPVLPTALPADGDPPVVPAALALTPAPGQTSPPTPVQVTGIAFGADGALLMVQFTAPPRVAQNWFQGSFSLTDEATGAVFDQVSVAPLIGPLISRPHEEGKAGYAMLTNLDNKQQSSLKGGERVTVTLGDYRFEHVVVQK